MYNSTQFLGNCIHNTIVSPNGRHRLYFCDNLKIKQQFKYYSSVYKHKEHDMYFATRITTFYYTYFIWVKMELVLVIKKITVKH